MSFSCNWDNHKIPTSLCCVPVSCSYPCSFFVHMRLCVFIILTHNKIHIDSHISSKTFFHPKLQLHKHSKNTNYEITVYLYVQTNVVETCGLQHFKQGISLCKYLRPSILLAKHRLCQISVLVPDARDIMDLFHTGTYANCTAEAP